MAAGADTRLSGHDTPEPHRIVALPFKGNDPYQVVAHARTSVPGTVGKNPTVKLCVSEGVPEAPPGYPAMGYSPSAPKHLHHPRQP